MSAEPLAPDAPKAVLPCPRPMMLEFLALNGASDRIEIRPLLSTRGWHDRRRRTFWPSEEGPALVLTRDDRWIAFTIAGPLDAAESDQPGPEPARELSDLQAMDWLAARGFDVPRRLQGRAPTGGPDPAGALATEPLTEAMRSILAALKELEAYSLTSACSQADIVKKAGFASLYTRPVRDARLRLKQEGLLDTQAGLHGGTWITPKGLEFLSR